TSFAAWFGLAECNAGDRIVIRHPSDTTRFTFRGSYETAVRAYQRALLLAPAFNLTFERRAADRLPNLLFTERWYWRDGILGGSGPRLAHPAPRWPSSRRHNAWSDSQASAYGTLRTACACSSKRAISRARASWAIRYCGWRPCPPPGLRESRSCSADPRSRTGSSRRKTRRGCR